MAAKVEPGDLRHGSGNGYGRGDPDALPLERGEEEQERKIVREKAHKPSIIPRTARPASAVPDGPGTRLGRGLRAAGYALRRARRRSRAQSKAGPGSVLRPGATSLCPTTSSIG